MAKNKTMSCPRCGAWTDIYDSRSPEPGVQRRKYVCANLHRFVTITEETFMGFLDEQKEIRQQVGKGEHLGTGG